MTAELRYFAKVSPSGEWDGLPKKKLRQEVAQMFGGQSIEIVIYKKKKHRCRIGYSRHEADSSN